MRSILVLLILVMIGLNGKGQSVTALPDSVLSQCCLEVTLLNGNVTTVDWVFIQYITRDGTGTKLFVEYAPNFGGIQWETQIRIQDDFDEVLERSKFIMLPFTVGSTDYAINRNWIANIEENTTTGGTWIYGRFGTPTKRKFSAVEDYETLKNLLLACRPRAIVVAENGLYTEGDTVRMGGFLIENTSITTEGYNWQMKDTITSQEFGISYNSAWTNDTTAYWARRTGSVRQLMQMGKLYYANVMQDTLTNGVYSRLEHNWNSGAPELRHLISDPVSLKVNSFINSLDAFSVVVTNDTDNPYYTGSLLVNKQQASIGVNESRGGYPGNGVQMGAIGYGLGEELLFMKTKNVDDNVATVGQYLQLQDAVTGEVEFATIDLSSYLPISDTSAMLSSYINTAGWGLLKSSKTLRVDSSKVATRYYAQSNPTTIIADRSIRSNGTNLVVGNITDNGTKLEALKPWQFQSWTTAGRPTGVSGYVGDNSTNDWFERYSSTAGAWISPTQDGRAGGIGSVNGAIHFNSSAFRTTESSTFTQLNNKLTLGVPSGSNPVVDIVVGAGDGTVNESAGMRLRHRTNNGNTYYMHLGVSNVAKGGSNQGFAYIQGGYWGGNYTNPLFINPKGGFVGFGTVSTAEWEVSVKSAIGINAPSFPPALGEGGRLVFSTGKGLNAPAQIAAYYDQANWYQGTGLIFKTESGADVSGSGNQGIERMRISSDGLVGIGKTPITYILDVGGTTAIGFPRGTTGTRPTWVTATTPLRFNTDTTAFEYATAAGTWSLLATRAYARSLVSGLTTTWLKTELEAGRDVNIAGTSSSDFKIQSTRIQFDGKLKIGSDSSFVHDPAQDTTFMKGYVKFGKQPSDDEFYDFTFRTDDGGSTALLIESGREPAVGGSAELTLRPSGRNNAVISYGNTDQGKGLAFYNINAGRYSMYLGSSGYVSGNSRTVIVGESDDPVQWNGNGSLVVYDTITSGKALFLAKKVSSSSTPLAMFSSGVNDRFTFNDDGTTRFHIYGTSATTAASLGKTQSNYAAGFATDGTLISVPENTEQYYTITSTSSPQTLSNDKIDNLINQGGTQATFTLNLPGSPVDGQVCKITYNNAISTLTLDGNGNTIVGTTVTTAVAGSQRIFKFYTGIGWIRQN